jgi:hypothetical protein
MMSMRLMACVKFLCAFLVLFVGGCLMKRTVTEDGVTVAEGYVVKGPLEM